MYVRIALLLEHMHDLTKVVITLAQHCMFVFILGTSSIPHG